MDKEADANDAGAVLHPAIFATKAAWCQPADLGTADCGLICHAEDSCAYVIKDGTSKNSAPLVPHCEWFCTQLAELVHIAAPPCKIIDMLDGTFVFGSRWMGGVLSANNGGHWFDRVKSGIITLSKIAPALSHIYAFDQFVCNVDRHCHNFIAHDHYDGYAILANDYSRAWVRNGFPLPPVPLPVCNTVVAQRHLRVSWGAPYINNDEVDVTLLNISNVKKDLVKRIIEEHPSEWLPKDLKSAILDWWGSQEMLARVAAISAGVKDESCL
jgi:hypothetical protein